MTEDELRAIEGRLAAIREDGHKRAWQSSAVYDLVNEDVPALMKHVRRLRARLNLIACQQPFSAPASDNWASGFNAGLGWAGNAARGEFHAPAPPHVAPEEGSCSGHN